MSDQLKFYKGIETDLPAKANIEPGALYHCMDTNNTYLGMNEKFVLIKENTEPNTRYGSALGFRIAAAAGQLTEKTVYRVGSSYYYATSSKEYISLTTTYSTKAAAEAGTLKENTYYYFTSDKDVYKTTDLMPSYELYSSAIGYRTPNQGIVIGEGEANASYALAGGSTDVSIATGLLGFDPTSYLSSDEQQLFINKSIADAPMSTSYGTTNITQTPGSLAMGLKNQSGILGYYVRAISSDGLILTLSKEQNEDVTPNLSFLNKWVNTYISFSDGEDFYALYGKVLAVSGNQITLDGNTVQNPVTELKDIDKTDAGSRMIYAIPETMVKSLEIFGINMGEVEICRSNSVGEVKFGHIANSFGFDNITAGNLSTTFGMRNNAIGATAFVTGRENTGSFASLVGGHKNTVTGAAGFATGVNNIVTGYRGAAIGANNITNGKYAFAAGLNNKAETQCSAVFGTGNTSNINYQLITGRYSELEEGKKYLFIVANGSSDTERSNAFTVDTSGNASIKNTLTVNGATTVNGTMKVYSIFPQTGNEYYLGNNNNPWKGIAATTISASSAIVPFEHETGSIGIETKCWKSLYIKGLQVNKGSVKTHTLYPEATNTYDLGTSDNRWNKIYGNGVNIVDGNIIPVKPLINGKESSVGTLGSEYDPWSALYVDDIVVNNTLQVTGSASFMSPVYMDNSLTVADPASFTSSVTISGETTITGKMTVNNNVTMSGNINPSNNKTQNIGSSQTKWGNLYVDGLSVYSGGKIVISSNAYGNEEDLPQTGSIGQIFFVKA